MNMRKNNALYMALLVCGGIFATSLGVADDASGYISAVNDEDAPKINATKSFSENLAANAPQKPENSDTKDKTSADSVPVERPETETWLRSLITKGTSDLFNIEDTNTLEKTEKKRVEQARLNRRSNAAYLDISGVKLRMSPKEIETILTAQGYRRIMQDVRIPNFIRWRSEEICRIHGIVGFERLRACAAGIARENGFEYVALEVYNRVSTKETMTILYTSSFTDNLAHHIIYKSEVPISDSKASPQVYINNLKIYDFWRRIDLRYGPPDNTSEVKWGLGGKKPYMQATTGNLELVDPVLKDLDSARMLNEDSRLANIPYYNF